MPHSPAIFRQSGYYLFRCVGFTQHERQANAGQYREGGVRVFWNGVDPNTGLGDASPTVPDRVSIATEGFALSAICVADTRGWVSHQDAYQRVLLILNSFYKDSSNASDFCVQGHDGLFYHFVNYMTGQRFGNSEVSTIDSGILMAGVLQCMEHFKGTGIDSLARRIYEAADWSAFLTSGGGIAAEWTP